VPLRAYGWGTCGLPGVYAGTSRGINAAQSGTASISDTRSATGLHLQPSADVHRRRTGSTHLDVGVSDREVDQTLAALAFTLLPTLPNCFRTSDQRFAPKLPSHTHSEGHSIANSRPHRDRSQREAGCSTPIAYPCSFGGDQDMARPYHSQKRLLRCRLQYWLRHRITHGMESLVLFRPRDSPHAPGFLFRAHPQRNTHRSRLLAKSSSQQSSHDTDTQAEQAQHYCRDD
jgi:hypothetical protein